MVLRFACPREEENRNAEREVVNVRRAGGRGRGEARLIG
jgi:hypothetical protein